MSIIDPKSQMSTFSMLVCMELGYPKTFSTKNGFIESISENCMSTTLIYSTIESNLQKKLQEKEYVF